MFAHCGLCLWYHSHTESVFLHKIWQVCSYVYQALRPHHRCAGESSLPACVGADRLQDRCADVQFFMATRRCIWGRSPLSLTFPVDGLCGRLSPTAWLCRPSDCQLSAAELFRLPSPGSGILYRSTSSRQQHFSLSRST